MFKHKVPINIFITDESVGIYQQGKTKHNQKNYASFTLGKKVVENGYILEPELFLKALKNLFKQEKITPKRIKMVIHGQNILVREVVISKEDLGKEELSSYLKQHIREMISFPFDNPNVAHHIKAETEDKITAVVVITDDDLLNDYYDVFDKLGVRRVGFDLSALALYRLYVSRTNNKPKNAMLVLLYEQMVAIYILEQGVPVFIVTEEYEGSFEKRFTVVEEYVERIRNYYRFNIRKGKMDISTTLVFNLAETITRDVIAEKLEPRIDQASTVIFNLGEQISMLRDVPKICQMAYATSVVDDEELKVFDIKIERIRKRDLVASNLLVLAFLIFSFSAIVFIPYVTLANQIHDQRSINNILQNQVTELIEKRAITQEYTQEQIDYSNAYIFLSQQDKGYEQKIRDVLSHVNGSLDILNYTISNENNVMTLIITADSKAELFEFVIGFYEDFGTHVGLTESRWVTERPKHSFLSELVMEVVISYA